MSETCKSCGQEIKNKPFTVKIEIIAGDKISSACVGFIATEPTGELLLDLYMQARQLNRGILPP